MIRITRALLSVHDKTGLADLGRGLSERGVELVSTGGTARALASAGLPVTQVSTVTGFPELFGGRVKTLHPLIHGGILFRREHADDVGEAALHHVRPIDLVAVSLYPFERTVAREGVTRAEAVEQVDIGGPAMIRAAAKNHAHVVVLTDPADHGTLLDEIARDGGVSTTTSAALAAKAFALTAGYDRAIATWLSEHPPETES